MSAYPAGPWTSRDVELWLVTAFRLMPFTAVMVSSAGFQSVRSPISETPSASFDILAFAETVLGRGTVEHRVVLLWARAKATKGEVGGSISEFCAAKDWKRSTFEHRRRRACARIAAAKNRTDAVFRGAPPLDNEKTVARPIGPQA